MVEIVDHGEGTRLGAPLVFVLGLKSGPQKTRKSGQNQAQSLEYLVGVAAQNHLTDTREPAQQPSNSKHVSITAVHRYLWNPQGYHLCEQNRPWKR